MIARSKKRYPEAELISLIAERQPEGALALYDMYSKALYEIIFRILPDTALSEDLLQETFIRVWQQFGYYDAGKGRLFTWMVNIARHLAIDQLRSKPYKNTQLTDTLTGEEYLALTPDSIYFRADRTFVRDMINTLPGIEKVIMELIYFQGLTHIEVAKALCIPLGTVKTKWVRAIRRLRSYHDTPLTALAS